MEITSLTIIGLPGSGKSTAATLTQKQGYIVISAGNIIRETCSRNGAIPSRETLIEIGELILESSAEDEFTNKLLKQGAKHNKVVYEGLRLEKSITSIRSAKNNRIIYIDADEQMRFDRLRSRENMTWNEFQSIELGQLEQQTRNAKKIADIIITNNKTIKHLETQITDYINQLNNANN